MIDVKSGLLKEAEYIASPNCNKRPLDSMIDIIVIHAISLPPNEFGGSCISDLFTNQLDPQIHTAFKQIIQLRVSAHLLITRKAKIIQYVPFHKRAWHAGVSNYLGRTNCNDFSVGIELEGCDSMPFENEQYKQLATVIMELYKYYPSIQKHAVVGHNEIAPTRKTDPGPYFDWEKLCHMINLDPTDRVNCLES